ncbi:MAG: estB 4 [Frankiales bacterium]|nr:estB 4 [Frankiales bacterium]
MPGYGGSVEGLSRLAAAIRATGRHVRVVAIPGQAYGSFFAQAKSLEAAVRSEEKAGRGPVDIVAHSNGGVLARYWARHYRASGRVGLVISLGSPQHGTLIADRAYALAPGLCTGSCREVRPRSAFLRALNAGDETPAGIQWVSVYTDNDTVVTPPTSTRLSGGVNVHLQAVCADAASDHSGLLGDPLPVGIVLDELAASTPRTEASGDCARLRALGS